MGPVEKIIKDKLQAALNCQTLEVTNESHQHNVPEGSESHFKVLLVTDEFNGLSKIARQRRVYQILSDELAGPVHALTLRTLTEAEYNAGRATSFHSPDCRGGMASESSES